MPVLTNSDLTFYKHALRNDLAARAEIKTSGLTKVQWTAAIQAIEDDYEARRLTIKAAMVAAAGVAMTNALAKKLGKVWMMRKLAGE